MRTILGIKIPSKKPLDEDAFIAAAAACGYPKLVALKLRDALIVYTGDENKVTQAFLRKIPDDEVEKINGVKTVGHKIINYLKER